MNICLGCGMYYSEVQVCLRSTFCPGLEEFRRHLASAFGDADEQNWWLCFNEFGVCDVVEGCVKLFLGLVFPLRLYP